MAGSSRVEIDRGRGEDVDVGSRDSRGARPQGGDGAQPRARCEVEHPPPGDGLRVVRQVARDREAAGPGEGPIRQRRVRVAGLELDRVPQRQHLIGQVQPDVLEPGDRPQVGLAQDERSR
jgi:hypothetical protein